MDDGLKNDYLKQKDNLTNKKKLKRNKGAFKYYTKTKQGGLTTLHMLMWLGRGAVERKNTYV